MCWHRTFCFPCSILADRFFSAYKVHFRIAHVVQEHQRRDGHWPLFGEIENPSELEPFPPASHHWQRDVEFA